MARYCERPGCSQPADAIYGMSSERLTVWLEPFDEVLAARVGVLCRRHADAMVVPRGWTLDDRREPTPQLFRTPKAAPDLEPVAKPKRSRKRQGSDDTGQLEFVAPEAAADPEVDSDPLIEPEPARDPAPDPAARADETNPDGTPFSPWRPQFDQSDDLDGLLSARSPLLSRAFRGKGRGQEHGPGQRPGE